MKRTCHRRTNAGLVLVMMVVLPLLAFGCGKKGKTVTPEAQASTAAAEKWAAENAEAVQAQLDHLHAIAAKAAKVESPVKTGKVDAPDLLFHSAGPKQKEGANAEVLAMHSLVSPDLFDAKIMMPVVSTEFLRQPATVLAKKDFPTDSGFTNDGALNVKIVTSAAEKLLGLKYVVVMRQTDYVPAEIAGDKFLSGLYRGDAMVYRVSDETLVGTVAIGVKNSPSIATKFSLKNGSNAESAVRSDLAAGIRPVTVSAVLKAMK